MSAALFYSLMCTTSLNFQEWHPGEWLQLLMDRDYVIMGRSWIKRLGGIQSLVGLYLLALLALSLFNFGVFD